MTAHTLWFSAFIIGLLGSTHCIGMCGGIASVFSAQASTISTRNILYLPLVYNLGRASSYAIAGAVVGAIGLSIGDLIDVELWSYTLRVTAGLIIVFLGVSLLCKINTVQLLEPLGKPIWTFIAPFAKQALVKQGASKSSKAIGPLHCAKYVFTMGLLWGWLPCGMVYSALLLALSAGNAVNGALVMFSFALGTFPALMLSNTLSNTAFAKIKSHINPFYVRNITGIVLLSMGLWTTLAPSIQTDNHNLHRHHQTLFQL